jgi:hypothetical protein
MNMTESNIVIDREPSPGREVVIWYLAYEFRRRNGQWRKGGGAIYTSKEQATEKYQVAIADERYRNVVIHQSTCGGFV